jgi:guanine nucleotide-binding protein G(i) subunit alpha
MGKQQDSEASILSKLIDQQIANDAKEFAKRKEYQLTHNRDPKILVLGSGDSGKTTLLKQMQILFGKGFSNRERREYKQLMTQFIISAIMNLIDASSGLRPSNAEHVRTIKRMDDADHVITAAEASAVFQLWNDPAIQAAFVDHVGVHESAKYFLPQVQEMTADTYQLTDADVLQLRVQTTNVTEHIFRIQHSRFRFYDVGGQRGLRKQWGKIWLI